MEEGANLGIAGLPGMWPDSEAELFLQLPVLSTG